MISAILSLSPWAPYYEQGMQLAADLRSYAEAKLRKLVRDH
jgi:hypothetical protein